MVNIQFVIFIITLIILFVLFKPYYYSIFDPIIFVFLTFAGAVGYSSRSHLFAYTILSVLAFWLAFVFTGKPKINKSFSFEKNRGFMIFELFVITHFVIFLLTSFVIFNKLGITLFSDNPTESKAIVSQSGMGIYRRIQMIEMSFLFNSLLLLIIFSSKKYLYSSMFLTAMIVAIMGGSKGFLLGVFICIIYMFRAKKLSFNERLLKAFKKYTKYVFILFAIIVIYIIKKEDGIRVIENISFRLMAMGDFMFYFNNGNMMDYLGMDIIDFFAYEFNGILGMFRLVDYKDPLGYLVVNTYLKSTTGETLTTIVGPNSIMMGKGFVFFKYWGIMYSFIIGLIIAKARRYILENKTLSLFVFSLLLMVFFELPSIAKDSGLVISKLFDFFFLSSVLFFIALLAFVFTGSNYKHNEVYIDKELSEKNND